MSQNPSVKNLSQSLKDFEAHLMKIGMERSTIVQRMRGAREFARFLAGKPHDYNEQTKGTI